MRKKSEIRGQKSEIRTARATLLIPHSALRAPHCSRRGVVLIVILGMLAALALIGIAFTTFAAQEENTSRSYRETNQNPRVDLDPIVVMLEALGQLVADTNNPHSAVRGHSLLRDMYGNDNDLGLGPDKQPGVAGVDDDQDGITDNMSELGWPGSDDRPNGVIDVWDYYARAFNGIGETGPDGIVGSPLGAPDDADIDFIYNGRRPEIAVFPGATPGSFIYKPGAGADESYDYPDHNNMFLGAWRADGACLSPSFYRPGYLNPTTWGTGPNAWRNVNDWLDTYTDSMGAQQNFQTGALYPAARGRRLMLRPRLLEHPSFGPGNLGRISPGPDGKPGVANVDDNADGLVDNAAELGWPGSDDGPEYDVDNNSDGRTDSIWIDIGYPVQTTLNGRRYKPLIAFMVMDMDGKLNLNAHGNLNFVSSHGDFPVGSRFHLGLGSSPTEINLENIFGGKFFPDVAGAGEYRQLFEGLRTTSGVLVRGKYGEVSLIASTTPPRPGRTGADDNRTELGLPGSFPGYPNVNNQDNVPFTRGGYFGRPVDPDGDGTKQLIAAAGGWNARERYAASAGTNTGWGNAGRTPTTLPSGLPDPTTTYWHSQVFPFVDGETTVDPATGVATGIEGVDDPAELNVYTSSNNDALHTPVDIETAYRYEDVDGSQLIGWLPGMIPTSRLAVLAPSLFRPGTGAQAATVDKINKRRRNMIGIGNWDTRNYNMPPIFPRESAAPTSALPAAPSLWPAGRYNGAFPDLYRNPPLLAQRFGVAKGQPNVIEGLAIPDAIRRGRRLNIAPQLNTYGDKYRLFRDLYILMIEVCGSQVPADRIAQFCANFVEFQDTEIGSIDVNVEERMHPYEFDNAVVSGSAAAPGVIDGWGVDGIHVSATDPTGTTGDIKGPDVTAGGQSDVVWGAEAPRLVISEVLAYQDSDGFVRLFIELYNISDKVVDLKGLNDTYELVWGDDNGQPTSAGEPSNSFLSNRMDFNTAGPLTTVPLPPKIPPGGYLLIGPESVPAKLTGGTAKMVDYQPASSFAPIVPAAAFGTLPYRLFLRRLADPSSAEDTTNRDKFPRSGNPYITIDALDFVVYDEPTYNDPDPLVFGNVVSRERESLNVRYQSHAPLGIDAMGNQTPTHSLGLKNAAATKVMPTIPWFDRPLQSAMELMLVPAVGAPHITTAYFTSSPQANFYLGDLEDRKPLETGHWRDAPFKNSDSDYLYSYLLNFFREDPTGYGPAETAPTKPLGTIKPRVRRSPPAPGFPPPAPSTVDASNTMPTPGFYRIFEFVEVPSRMTGARDPNNQELPGSTGGYSLVDRVVGKININTMWEQEILQAACNNHPVSLDPASLTSAPGGWYPDLIPTFNAGPPVIGTSGVPLPIPNSPLIGQLTPAPYQIAGTTVLDRETGNVTGELWRRILMSIANPTTAMRVGANGNIVTVPGGDGILFTPDDRPVSSITTGYPTATTLNMAKPPSIQDTIFRGFPSQVGGGGATVPRPLFSNDIGSPPPGLDGAAGAPTELGEYPEFQWQLYQKLSNMLTTRSNTYAVWITVGFFEVLDEDPERLNKAPTAQHPNWRQFGILNAPPELGAEINADIQQNIRHRAFFIIDRSRARGYLGPPRSSDELQDILSQTVVHSRMIE